MKRILFFGDSITAGSALPPEERGQVWPTLIEKESRGAFQALNAGKGGRPSDSFPEFVGALAQNLPVDLLVIALGTNDSRDLAPDCAARAAAHIETMIAHARDRGVPKVLLVAPCTINRDALGPTKPIGRERDAQLRAIGAALRDLARRTKTGFASTYGVVSDRNLTRDGVHPNAAGNREIARFLLPILRRQWDGEPPARR
jgi:acyl-CoA thioesterase-1